MLLLLLLLLSLLLPLLRLLLLLSLHIMRCIAVPKVPLLLSLPLLSSLSLLLLELLLRRLLLLQRRGCQITPFVRSSPSSPTTPGTLSLKKGFAVRKSCSTSSSHTAEAQLVSCEMFFPHPYYMARIYLPLQRLSPNI